MADAGWRPRALPAGQRDPLDDPGKNLLWQLAADHCLGGGQQPVCEHRPGQRLNVVGNHEAPVFQCSIGTASAEQVQRGSRRCTEAEGGRRAGR